MDKPELYVVTNELAKNELVVRHGLPKVCKVMAEIASEKCLELILIPGKVAGILNDELGSSFRNVTLYASLEDTTQPHSLKHQHAKASALDNYERFAYDDTITGLTGWSGQLEIFDLYTDEDVQELVDYEATPVYQRIGGRIFALLKIREGFVDTQSGTSSFFIDELRLGSCNLDVPEDQDEIEVCVEPDMVIIKGGTDKSEALQSLAKAVEVLGGAREEDVKITLS